MAMSLGVPLMVYIYLNLFALPEHLRMLLTSIIVGGGGGGRGGLVVNASDSGFRGLGFEPHSGQTVLCP